MSAEYVYGETLGSEFCHCRSRSLHRPQPYYVRESERRNTVFARTRSSTPISSRSVGCGNSRTEHFSGKHSEYQRWKQDLLNPSSGKRKEKKSPLPRKQILGPIKPVPILAVRPMDCWNIAVQQIPNPGLPLMTASTPLPPGGWHNVPFHRTNYAVQHVPLHHFGYAVQHVPMHHTNNSVHHVMLQPIFFPFSISDVNL